MAYVNNWGGTKSDNLLNIAVALFDQAVENQIFSLSATPGPPQLPRGFAESSPPGGHFRTDSLLRRQGVSEVLVKARSGPRGCKPLPSTGKVCSPFPGEGEVDIDVVSTSWAGVFAHIFSPWPVTAPVLAMLALDTDCTLISSNQDGQTGCGF